MTRQDEILYIESRVKEALIGIKTYTSAATVLCFGVVIGAAATLLRDPVLCVLSTTMAVMFGMIMHERDKLVRIYNEHQNEYKRLRNQDANVRKMYNGKA